MSNDPNVQPQDTTQAPAAPSTGGFDFGFTPAAPAAPANAAPTMSFADAVAKQEAAHPDLNNPGNIKDMSTGQIRKFDSPEEGQAALQSQLQGMINGSQHYPAGTTLRQAGMTYSGGDPNWSKNVAKMMGVSEDTPMSQLQMGGGASKGFDFGFTPKQAQAAPQAPQQAQPAEQQGTISKMWDWANKGIISKDTILKVADYVDNNLTPENGRIKPGTIVHVPGFGDIDAYVFKKGVDNSIAGILSTFSSPISIALFGVGGAAGAAGKAVQTARLGRAVKAADAAAEAAEAAYAGRTGEAINAAKQASEAHAAAEEAFAAEQAGTGSREATVAARDLASQARANASKAMKAVTETEQAHAAARVRAAQVARDYTEAQEAVEKSRLAKLAAENVPEKTLATAAKAGTVVSKTAGVGFTGLMAEGALTPRQEGESRADYLERVLTSTAFGTMGAGELVHNAHGALVMTKDALGHMAEWHATNQRVAEATARDNAQVQAKKDFMGAIKPGRGKAAFDDNDYAVVRPFLEDSHGNQAIEDPKDVYDALENQRQGIENVVKPWVETYKNNDLNLGKNHNGDPVTVKQKLVAALLEDDKVNAGFMNDGLKAIEGFNTTNPTVGEADAIRAKLNAQMRGTLTKNHWDVSTARATDPEFAAKYELNEILRDGIYGTLEFNKVNGAKEMRQAEASIIKVRNAADAQLRNAEMTRRGTGETSAAKKAAAWLTKKAGIASGAALGASTAIPGATEAGAVVGGMAGEKVGELIAPDNKTVKQLIKRSMKVSGAPDTRPTIEAENAQPGAEKPAPHPRENSPLHADLATHYGETVGDSSYQDLERKFMSDVRIKKDHGVPLEGDEKTLLTKVNQAKIKEITDAQKAAEDQAKEEQKLKAQDAKDAKKALEAAEKKVEPKAELTPEEKAQESQKKAEATILANEPGEEEEPTVKEEEELNIEHPHTEEGERADEEEQLTTPELQSELKQDYLVGVTNQAGERNVETIPAFSYKDAVKRATKAFPEAKAIEAAAAPVPRVPSTEYKVPTKSKILSMGKPSVSGKTPLQTMIHELGHVFMGRRVGMSPDFILGRNHPAGKGSRAAVRWDIAGMTDPNGRFKPEHIPTIISNLMGGIAADEGINGIDRTKNHNNNPEHRGSDRHQAERILRGAGYTPEDAAKFIDAHIDANIEHLTHPVTRAMIEENAPFREEGLSNQYHFSGERLNQMHAEHGRRMAEYEGQQQANNRGNGGEGGEGRGVVQPRAEAGAAEAPGAVPAQAEAKAETEVESPEDAADRKTLQNIVEKLTKKQPLTPEERTEVTRIAAKKPLATQEQLGEPHHSILDNWLETKSGYHPDLQGVIKQTRSLTDDPSRIKEGAAFIAPDGQYTYLLPGQQHPDLIAKANPERVGGAKDNRVDFLNDTGTVRTRFTLGRGGPSLSVSVPADGVTPKQVEAIRKAVGASIGRNGNLTIETAGREGIAPRAQTKEFASPRDVDQLLRDIGAHPDQKTLETRMQHEPMAALAAARRADYANHEHDLDWQARYGKAAQETAARQIAAHEANGGSTYSASGENLSGANKYAVGAHSDRTKVIDKLTPEILNQFKSDNADLLADGKHSVGTWKDPETGKTVLDVSQLFDNRDEAVAAGKALNQKSIYHLGGEGEIQTGGKGSPAEQAQPPVANAEPTPNRAAALRAKPLETREMNIGNPAQNYDESKLPYSQPVKVTWPDGMVHEDEVRGLNAGHALARAKSNWEGAKVEPNGEGRRFGTEPLETKEVVNPEVSAMSQQDMDEINAYRAAREKERAGVNDRAKAIFDRHQEEVAARQAARRVEVLPRTSNPEARAEFQKHITEHMGEATKAFMDAKDPAAERDALAQIGRLQNMKAGIDLGDKLTNKPEFRTDKDNQLIRQLMERKQQRGQGETPLLTKEVTEDSGYPTVEHGLSDYLVPDWEKLNPEQIDRAVRDSSYATYTPDEIRDGDPWLNDADKKAGVAAKLRSDNANESGFMHPDGSMSMVGDSFLHDAFEHEVGLENTDLVKKAGIGTYNIWSASHSDNVGMAFDLPAKPTDGQIQTIAALTKHMREASGDKMTSVTVEWPGGSKEIEFPTPGRVVRELRGEGEKLQTREPEEEGFNFGKNVEGTPDQQKGLISTRLPSSAKSTENPLEQDLQVGRKAIEQTPGVAAKMAKLVREYPGMKIPENIKDPEKILDRFTNHVKDNLKALWNQVDPAHREQTAKWYDSANKMVAGMAEKYGKTTKQLAGVVAAMSPQKDWDQNVSLAHRVNDIYHNHQNTVATPEMIAKGHEIGARKTGEVFKTITPKLEGKTFSELTDTEEKAAWLRLYDEAHNPREFHSIDPGTGESRGVVMTSKGVPRRVGWGSLNEIGKAISILEDGSRENISNNLGGEHKVRNFYNNILDPNNPAGHITIDTHAVAAALMRPLSGKSAEVLQNFGGKGAPGSVISGVNGTYPLYADAYRQAAAELGIQPRQLQSVVWEEIRKMFPAEMKRIPGEAKGEFKHVKAIDDLWNDYADKKNSLDKTHQLVRDYSSKAATEMAENRKPQPAKITANQLLEALGQAGLFALGGKK